MDTPFQGWIANLSDGNRVFEQPPVAGEKSSWQKLLDHLAGSKTRITQLKLERNQVTVICSLQEKIRGFVMAYEARMGLFKDDQKRMQGIGTIIDDHVFISWIDDNGNVRQEIRPLAEMRVHSTLRDEYGINGETEPTTLRDASCQPN